ncbi:MAG: PilZ domain-containing protein [Candidatus Omnitrophica bacterium]|jgi:c-di-GMP-binding flagellar brake protein YcgR|nr:PilZ domain-containing protein [Candidatus Omnitrophota bacterium]
MYDGIEKRKFIRARFPCKILIYSFPEHTVSTHTENISAGGVRVIVGERIETGKIVGIEVHLKENKIVCKGRITWVVGKKSPYRKGIFYHDTGIEFCEISDQDRSIISVTIEKMLCPEK